MRRHEQPAAILNAAICTGRGNPELDLQIEVLHDGIRPDIPQVMLPRRLDGVGVNGAVVDRPNVSSRHSSL